MIDLLHDLATICNRPAPAADDVAEACALIASAVGATDAYVLRAGDPSFVRVGCDCVPDSYEVKQKGYWLVWRELAAAAPPFFGFDVAERMVARPRPLKPGDPATHLAAILPSDESNSELLVVRGPWSDGVDLARVRFLTVARTLLAQLVGRTLDSERTLRHRAQLEALANVSRALSDAREGSHVLTDLATALAKASGFDYVTIVTYNEACDEVTDRAMNRARHSETETAARFQGRQAAGSSPSELRLGVELGRTGDCIRLPDVFEPGLAERPDVALLREDIPGLQRYWERAHVLSMALFPIMFQGRPLGFITFNAAQARSLDEPEVEFLRALVVQSATAIEGLRLYQDLQRSQEAIRQNERSLRALLNATDDTVLLVDPEGTILTLNQATEDRLTELAPGATGGGLVGRSIFDFFPPDIAAMREARNDEVVRTGKPARFEDERGDYWTDNSLYPVFDGAGAVAGLAIFQRDITERKVAERELAATLERLRQSREALAEKSALLEQTLASERERARRDPLTQALNHGAISVALRELVERPVGRVAVLIVDVNGMKVLNDTYGHVLGDHALIAVAEALQLSDALVGRYGGDEFVVVLRGADRSASEAYRDAVVAALGQRLITDVDTGATVQVAVSIGIAVFPEEAASVSELLQQSDEEMYAAKRQRPLLPGGFASARLTPDDRLPAIIGDLVPMLLARRPLNDTLRTIAHRLAMHTGYAAVNFDIFGADHQTVVAQNAFLRASDDVLGAWRNEQLGHREHPITLALRQTQAAFIIPDVSQESHLTESQREILGAAGVRSAVSVPISIDGTLIGVMSVGSCDLAAFSERDGEFLMGVAGRLAQLIALIQRLDEKNADRAA